MDVVKQKFSSQFIRNLSWLSGSEVIIRIFRLVTTVTLSHFLTAYDYGLAAVVLTTNEFVQVFTRFGIGTKLIQVEEERLQELSIAAYWLNWLIYLGLFIIQCVAAFLIAWSYRDNRLILPICAISLVYLIVPIAYVQSILVQRENNLRITAITNVLQVSLDNVLTALFAFLGFGMWAIVLPKILVAPIWVIIYYKSHPWRPTQGFSTKHWGEILRFGRSVLGVELLRTLRNNLDYLIVGWFISIEELGIYYFAFNAGLGISLSFINAINSALFPHLCAVRSNWEKFHQRYLSSFKTISLVIIPVVLLQSSLAPIYVPLVFGQKWVAAIPVLIIICLSAISRPFADAASQMLIAIDKSDLDLISSFIFTIVFAIGLLIGVHWGVLGVAISVLLTHAVFQSIFTLWATRYVFKRFNGFETI
ncbi:MAG: lipopolysaccharide biosynthesis protein [Leptolyngbyaceae cyanobacterium SU_3_3]|nr:lipopolysaccharide biosynthesis protein [Leptolyngbyaceae cyanobacterium SU_3_3]NJR50568.1 lipopolysaccharide biosynthesis protein [Leptolyngbyaceae cyanobacterium CSU_1_3]